MLKKITLILLIFTFSFSYGQYEWTPGKIILKRGDTIEGFIQIPMSVARLVSFGKSKVEFRKHMEGGIIFYDKSQINKIYFDTYELNPGYYEYVPIKRKKIRLFKLLVNGNARLYKRTVAVEHESNSYNSTELPGITKYEYEEENEYYIIRKDESSLTPLISHYSLKKFNEIAINYFSDCKDLIEYLKNDIYDEMDVIELVKDYNLICD